MQLDDVFEKIKRSARLKIDWSGLEDGLIEFAGTEKGSLIAEHVLSAALVELSMGKGRKEVTAGVNSMLKMASVHADVGDFVAEVEKKCQAEIEAYVQVRTMNAMGLQSDEIYNDLRPQLLSLSVDELPLGEERQRIMGQVVDPIIRSGRTRIDYADFKRRASEEDPAKGEERLGRVFECVLALFSEADDPKIIVEHIKARMKPGTYPTWLDDLVSATITNCKRERSALMAMNIGFCMGKSVDELERIVNIRLKH